MICLHFVAQGPSALIHKLEIVKGKEFQPKVGFPLDLCVRGREKQIESPVVTCKQVSKQVASVPGKGGDTGVPLK